MMIRKILAIGAALSALMFVAPAAQALHCENVSRPVDTSHARTVDLGFGTIYVQGNWVVLPFEPDVWIFVPPGTLTLIGVTDPVTPAGQTGNYMGGDAFALLENMCDGHGLALDNRQISHGIQAGCGP
jgi:hypothetical protein